MWWGVRREGRGWRELLGLPREKRPGVQGARRRGRRERERSFTRPSAILKRRNIWNFIERSVAWSLSVCVYFSLC